MIGINLDRAKTVAHQSRRAARSIEFAPYDDVIAKQIPGLALEEAEAQRQAIRERHADLQFQIDSAADHHTLVPIVNQLTAIIGDGIA